MNTSMSEEHTLLVTSARQLAAAHLAPRAAEIDQGILFPQEAIGHLAQAGFLGLCVPSRYGGVGAGTFAFVLATEELAKACASTGFALVTHAAACEAILLGGTEEQRQRYLPALATGAVLGAFAIHEENAGVQAAAIETRAVPDGEGFVLSGSKMFTTNGGAAGLFVVLARTENPGAPKEFSLLLVEQDTAGFSTGPPRPRMGLNGIASRDLIFQDCRLSRDNLLGKAGDGLRLTKATAAFAMLGAAATSLGIAQAAFEASIGHARRRSIAGQPLAAHQAVQGLVAEMQADIASARALLYETARGWDPNAPGPAAQAFTAKLVAADMAVRVADRALQVHGGHGYTRELPIERCYRDARGLTLHFMTAEMLRMNIAQALLAA
ncbi:MAG: acyl-CoA dehydrogenase family protein [candidate division NC10 bacterium]|nr:acyl-CoA dehydrogenase family protein [candidate division NC10 bacterium]